MFLLKNSHHLVSYAKKKMVFVLAVFLLLQLNLFVIPSFMPVSAHADENAILFDDFDYAGPLDPELGKMGWTPRDGGGGPGVVDCSWSKDNISFVSDGDKSGNKVARLTATTDGTGAGTSQAELFQKGKFYEGTYATRVKFNDTPAIGPDGDNVVETFFTITLGLEGNPNYGENDFEYLPNGGWGEKGPVFYETTWENVIPDPWWADRDFANQYKTYDGWHTLVCTVMDGHVKYFIDDVLVADHTDKYYPEIPMSINYNLWFINGGTLNSSEVREYTQDIDWVYYAEDTALTTDQVKKAVESYRKKSVERVDSVKDKTGVVPAAAVLNVDNAINTGNYTVQATIPAKNTVTSLKLYENDKLVLVKQLKEKPSKKELTVTYPVKGKAIGTYKYRADLANPNGTKSSSEFSVTVVKMMFDDFSYKNSSDSNLGEMGWTVRGGEGGPGVIGCNWSKENVTFINDPSNRGNKVARLTATTNGTGAGTSQAEIAQQQKFYEGTYAARVKFNDVPKTGPDGDSIVETFFTITSLNFDKDPDYSECDFEYMPNGGWGDTAVRMYETTWETYVNDPWFADRASDNQEKSLSGWHTLICTVKDGHVKYYIDNSLVADHSDKYYPEVPMSINFNLWFVNGWTLNSSEPRVYTQDIDWVYYAEGTELTPEQVQSVVGNCRESNVTRIDTVEAKTGAIPDAASLSVDSPKNNGIYTVTVTVPAGDTATSLRLLENDKLVLAKSVTSGSEAAQAFSYHVEGNLPSTYIYRAELTNTNGTKSSTDLSVEVVLGNGAPVNAAFNKPAKWVEGALPVSATAITDGSKSDPGAFSGAGEGLQWVQIDLGSSYDINRINLWHYFGDPRIYHDVIIQVSNNEDFTSGITTVFNNDSDNSAGLGTGTDSEYAETSAGKTVDFDTVNARYVRLYTNGSDANAYNHYVEVEVWTEDKSQSTNEN